MNTISVLQNTNRIIASSEDNLSYIREGSFIKIGNDNILYFIGKKNKFFFIKDFEAKTSKILFINDDSDIILQKNDNIKISYQNFELDTVLEIVDKGKLYRQGQIITIMGGEPEVDIKTGLSYPTKLVINRIDDKGAIQELSLKEIGRYIIPPKNNCRVFGGTGEDCVLNLNYKKSDNKTIVERKIISIEKRDNQMFITLNYPINKEIKNGKISVEKWEIILSSNYVGESQINTFYEIYKDFTPNLRLPLLVKNSQSLELIFNRCMSILDSRIKDLENKIK